MHIEWDKPSKPGDSLVVFSGIGLLLLLAGRFYPFDRYPLVHCPMRTFAHVPCPSCGMTRAFMRFTHGEWLSALRVNPIGLFLAMTATFFAVYAVLRLTVLSRGLSVRLSDRESRVLRWGIPSAFLANWVYLLVSGAAN